MKLRRSGAVLWAWALVSGCEGPSTTGQGGGGASTTGSTSTTSTTDQSGGGGQGGGGASSGGAGGQGGTASGGAGGRGGAGGSGVCDDPTTCVTHMWSRGLDLLTMTPVALDASGNILFAGTTVTGTLDLGTGPLPGTFTSFVAKLDPAGEVLFAVPFEPGYVPIRVAAGPAGEVFVIGAADLGKNAYLRKLAPEGSTAWSKVIAFDFTNPGADLEIGSLAALPDGSVVCAGRHRYNVQVDSTTISGSLLNQAIVMAFSATGALSWYQSATANNGSAARGLAVDAAGVVWMSGNSGGQQGPGFGVAFNGCDATGPTFAISQVFLARFNGAGTCPGVERFDGKAYGYGGHVVRAGADVYLGGTLVPQDPSNLGAIDLGGGLLSADTFGAGFLAQRTEAGAHVWSRLLPEGHAAQFDVDASGRVLLPGDFEGSLTMFGPTQTSAGQSDVYLARLGDTGAADLVLRYGASGKDAAISLAVDPTGAAVMNGSFTASINFGGAPLTEVVHSADPADFFLVKLMF